MSKTTISEYSFLERFNTEEKAVEFFEMLRWGKERTCPSCGSGNTYPHTSRQFYHHCREKDCRLQFSCKTGTVMQSSKLPVRMWLYAMYKVNVARKGISSLQLAKQLGITQKTSWFMIQRIKEACGNDNDTLLSGIVEIDETYIGGLERNKHESKKLNEGRGTVGKIPVLGMRERGGRVRAKVIEDRKAETLGREITGVVEKGSVVFTDEYKSYNCLIENDFEHGTVNHSAKEYVKGMASTNGIESVWAVLKRSIIGTYHHVSLKHLHRYVNEAAFRLNEGDVKNKLMDRIEALCCKMVGVRLSYRELVG